MPYVAGWNAPGCLPDTTEPLPTFDTFNDAVRYLAGEVERHWDEDYQDTTGTRGQVDAKYLPVHTALHNAPVTYEDGTHSFSETTGDGGTVYFIEPTEG